jgi:phosphoribosylanthranilate isomerase
MTAVKICGVRSVADARVAVDAGADALGLNFWARSPRRCHLEEATRIARTVGDRVRLVGVYVDASIETIEDTRARTGVRWAQLHGDEPEAMLRALLPEAYRAVHAVGPGGRGAAP